MAFSFRGGIHPEYNKEPASKRPIETLPPPEILIFPMKQHIGAPCQPLVSVGEHVKVGQKIGTSSAPVSSPVHSSVSGTVVAIEPHPHPSGEKVLSVIVKNDFADELSPSVVPYGTPIRNMTAEDLIKLVRDAGIVGLGGATFPSHIKIASAEGKADTLIVNGAECEPYITCDHRIMLEHPKDIINGARLVAKCLNIRSILIGIEENKPDAIKAMKDACENDKIIKVRVLKAKYPQGGEKQLINALTHRMVPPGKLPADVGCLVFNVETCRSIWNAYVNGMPVIERVVTVSGTQTVVAKNLLVRIGTPISKLFEHCAGFITEPKKIVVGGPMMGIAQYTMDVPVTKGVSAVLAFGDEDVDMPKAGSCIRCGRCVQVCPMNLMPNYLGLWSLREDFDALARLNLTDCIECGSCSYVCPSSIPLVQLFRASKQKLNEKKSVKVGG